MSLRPLLKDSSLLFTAWFVLDTASHGQFRFVPTPFCPRHHFSRTVHYYLLPGLSLTPLLTDNSASFPHPFVLDTVSQGQFTIIYCLVCPRHRFSRTIPLRSHTLLSSTPFLEDSSLLFTAWFVLDTASHGQFRFVPTPFCPRHRFSRTAQLHTDTQTELKISSHLNTHFHKKTPGTSINGYLALANDTFFHSDHLMKLTHHGCLFRLSRHGLKREFDRHF